MTTLEDVHRERFRGGDVVELRPEAQPPRSVFGPALRCEIPGCTDRATLVIMEGDQGGAGRSRRTCAWHVDDTLYQIGLVTEGTVIIRRLR